MAEQLTVADVLAALGQLDPSTPVVDPYGEPVTLYLDGAPDSVLAVIIGTGEGEAEALAGRAGEGAG